MTKGQRFLLWISAIIGINIAAWLFDESPLAAIAVAVASVFSAYTAMRPGGEPLARPEGISRFVLWVVALIAGAFGALIIAALVTSLVVEDPGPDGYLSPITLALSCVGVSVALIRWLRT